MDRVPKSFGIKLGHDLREDFGRTILDSPNDTEQDPTGDPAPGAIASPDVALEGLFMFDLTRAQWTGGPPCTRRPRPPAAAVA
jgi:hypothetical protein